MGGGTSILPCFKSRPPEEQRELIANDDEYNSTFLYLDNSIKTSYYTWWNFIFKNLFEQFHRVVNIYFIFILILTCIPVLSSLNPVTTILPIIFVLGITAIKDGYDDVYRHKSDNFINNRQIKAVKAGNWVEKNWKDVLVGDVVLVNNNDHIAADILLLTTSDDNNQVYVETAELDGESNLKVRQPLPVTRDMGRDIQALSAFKGKLTCEAPNNRLDRFSGNLEVKGEKYGLDNEKILLRGCTLRNTDWCFGLVVFAGHETKLMKNTGRRYMKRTSIEKQMNTLVWWIFGILILLSAIAAIFHSVFERSIGDSFQVYLPWEEEAPNPTMAGFLVFWSFLIILNTLVPISLYVSVEMIRLVQSLLINWDMHLYYAKKNLPAVARTTTLNEELGQVQYIFSDKTGTLTQNMMSFKKCTINGMRYGDVEDEMLEAVENDTAPTVDLTFNRYAEPSFRFYDSKLVNAITKDKNEKARLFFQALSLCHTSLIEKSLDGSIQYRAQSPDEGALVSAARNFGFVFTGKTYDTLTIEAMGDEITYKVLGVLEFNSDRKRMSVILQTPDDKIILFCKGADSVILERLRSSDDADIINKTNADLDYFANSGLRTLCVAMKEIDKETFKVWNEAFKKANQAIEDKEGQLAAVSEEIERDLELLGATAIEDKLQDGVPETIKNLKKADIKIWVLTGDKQETAINIGHSCNMLKESMEKMIIKGYTTEEVKAEIENYLSRCSDAASRNGAVNLAYNGDLTNTGGGMDSSHGNSSSRHSSTSSAPKPGVEFGLIVNGHSLFHALEDHRESFVQLSTQCSAVICCRATPLQKAKVVELIKKSCSAVTLAIGDGANDVSMIKAAHIGIGISGEEGTQAVLSSDFSFGQFRYLERLLLVHGRWSYMRICKFLNYFFYKNFAFTLIHFWYGPFTGFTAQSAYDSWFVTCYNIFYTSQPILWLAVLEQDLNPEFCVRFPRLYLPGQRNELFNTRIFIKSIVRGIITSLVIFFMNYGVFCTGISSNGIDRTDYQTFSQALSTSLIMVVTLQVALDTSFWTFLNIFFTFGSIGVYFMFSYALYSKGLYSFIPSQFPFVGSATTSFQLPALWFSVLLTTTVCILPAIIRQYIMRQYMPTYADEVLALQSCERAQRRAARSNEPGIVGALTHRFRNRFPLRRRSSASRSKSQSGYAFSHERGFGDLITTGRMSMRRRPPIASIIPGSESGTVRAVSVVSETSCHSPATGGSSPAAAIPTTLPGVDVSMTSSRDSQTIVA